MRLIDADAVLYALVGEVHDNATKYGFRIGDIIKLTPTQVDEIVSRMPTIEERKRGKWIVHYECPKCGEITKDFMEYCPFCNADMRGE